MQVNGANISFLGPLVWPVHTLKVIIYSEFSCVASETWQKWNTSAYVNNIRKLRVNHLYKNLCYQFILDCPLPEWLQAPDRRWASNTVIVTSAR